MFLDAVMEEFIQKSETGEYKGIENTLRFAKKSRALGLGVLGYHSFLQSKIIPFISIEANAWTNIIFKHIKDESEKATLEMGQEYGSPEWCEGTGRRNLTLLAIAPNRSSSKLAGGISQGIEPLAANLYMDDDAKGLHIRKNPFLEKLLDEKGKNISQVWDTISEDKGSVKNVRCLSVEEKNVFKTFKEINQLELVKQAVIRQKYIDQGQSINLAFFKDAPAKFINQVHIEAWKGGLKSLYYLRSESILRADTKDQRDLYSECLMCEG
jgi:ribonucleoside-diphosphate reductase alpha chain